MEDAHQYLRLGLFYDVCVTSVDPPGLATKGQRMFGESGTRWLHLGLSYEYTVIDATHDKLEMDASLPIGITIHEAMECILHESERCRVRYPCNFGFPNGWRGRLTRVLLSRGLKVGPADSLLRL